MKKKLFFQAIFISLSFVYSIDYKIEFVENLTSELLQEIGKFRFDIWSQETDIDEKQFPDGIWIDALDESAYHWIVRNEDAQLIAVARMTIHQNLDDNAGGYDNSDCPLWKDKRPNIALPVANFCKLIVHPKARRCGLGTELSKVRIDFAKKLCAKTVIVTASEKNLRLLQSLGFFDTGIRTAFDNRPNLEFVGLELDLTKI